MEKAATRLLISMENISCGFWYTKTADYHHAMESPVSGVTMYLHDHGYCLCQVTCSLSTSDGNRKPAFRIEIINEIISCGHVVAKLLVTEYRCSWLVLSFRNKYSCSSSECP